MLDGPVNTTGGVYLPVKKQGGFALVNVEKQTFGASTCSSL